MKKQSVPLVVTLWLACLLAAGPANAEVLFSTFGPEDSYDMNSGWPIGMYWGYCYEAGHQFSFEGTQPYHLDSIELAVALDPGATIVVALMTDDVDEPGSVLELLEFTNETESIVSDVLLYASGLRPQLTPDANYWLVASAPDGTSYATWYLSPSSSGQVAQIINGRLWGPWLTNMGAFRINGSPVSGTLEVRIDIKPGSYPNSININGNGVIPVAVLGSESFDVTQIDRSTLLFAGLPVRVKGNGAPQCSVKDVDGDGYDDLVCQFVDNVDDWVPGDAEATLTGNLLDGTPFAGTDTISIVP